MIITLLYTMVLSSLLGALLSLLCKGNDRLASVCAVLGGLVSAGSSILLAGNTILERQSYMVVQDTPFSFARFEMLISPLSGFLIFVIAVLSIAVWIYGVSYMEEYKAHGIGKMGCFLNLFIISMQLVILADNAFWFLVFFELMSLASYFLVILEETSDSIKAGLLYLVMAHIGLVMIMVSFFAMAHVAGSLSFTAFRSCAFSPGLASLVFVLCFLGFGIKAGMIPFHSWLPLAHPAAPSNVSCLMSGGMIKIGIFGIVKVGFDLLQSCHVPLWWGVIVLLFGAVSSVLGVIYALVEHDLKRLLAYHSVENIGIILMGVGISLIGVTLHDPFVAALGLMAGLYHLINHAIFKGLLFLGAGSVMFAAHTKDMDQLGGLEHMLPVTAICFLIGALAISAIPPLNGFVSEWFTYQALITAAANHGAFIAVVSVVTVVALAITGALAVTCFVKAYGITFAGKPRTNHARAAREVPAAMQIGSGLLALACIALGLGAPWIAPVILSVAQSCAQVAGAGAGSVMASGSLTIINAQSSAMVSTLIMAGCLVGFFIIIKVVKGIAATGGSEARSGAWMCGYEFNFNMPVQATSFAANMKEFFTPLYSIRSKISAQKVHALHLFTATQDSQSALEPLPDRYLVDKPAHMIERISSAIRVLAHGNFQTYCLYIVVALVVMLGLAIYLVK